MHRKRIQTEQIILQYEDLKAAAGGSGAGGGRGRRSGSGGKGGGGYKAGQDVVCKIIEPSPGGYDVVLLKDNLKGFLPTQVRLNPGAKIVGQFVCMHNERALLTARYMEEV